MSLAPVAPGSAALTVKTAIHLFVEPWCVYTLPKTVTFPAQRESRGEADVTSKLDKSASFGTCSSTRSVPVVAALNEGQYALPFVAEVVG